MIENDDNLHQSINKQWYFHPKLPVGFYPFFDWPPSPKRWLKFIWNYWLQKSDRTIFLILSFLIFYFIVPPMQEMVSLEIGWISMLAIRNYILIFIVAGGLHWWFFLYQGQGNKFKYRTVPISAKRESSYWSSYG